MMIRVKQKPGTMALLHYHSLVQSKKHVVKILTEIEKIKLGRRYSVLNCISLSITSSHKFLKDLLRREKWLKKLILKPSEEIDINKLRVCYKNCKESGYGGCPKVRKLIYAAIPSMIETERHTQQK